MMRNLSLKISGPLFSTPSRSSPSPSSRTPRARRWSKPWPSPSKRPPELRAAEKAIIFTESRKTQPAPGAAHSEFKDGIVLFNGSNTDDRSKAIYAAWLDQHAGTDRVTGSKSADMRSALVDYFRDEVLGAIESGVDFEKRINDI